MTNKLIKPRPRKEKESSVDHDHVAGSPPPQGLPKDSSAAAAPSPQSKTKVSVFSATLKRSPSMPGLGKMATKMKRQLGRFSLDGVLHHVTPGHGNSNAKAEDKQDSPRPKTHNKRNRTVSSSSTSSTLSTKSVSAIKVVRALFPSSSPSSSRTSSTRSRTTSTWSSPRKSVKGVLNLESDSSSEHLPIPAPFSVVPPTATTTTTESEITPTIPTPIPPSSSISSSMPTVPEDESVNTFEPSASLQVYVEPDVPDPFLLDDEEDVLSSTQDESSAAVSQSVSPSHNVPLDLPASPNPDLQQPLVSPLPNLNKEMPPPPPSKSDSEEEESEEEEIPDIYVPSLIVPTMFLPIPNVRRPFSSNYLTWWLQRTLLTKP